MLELSTVVAMASYRLLRSRPRSHRGNALVTVDAAFEALADPVRRGLVQTLAMGPRSAGSLASPFEISRPAVSRHLRVLREAGLVEVEPLGRRRLYRLAEGALDGVNEWIAEVGALWDEALMAFKRHAEARG